MALALRAVLLRGPDAVDDVARSDCILYCTVNARYEVFCEERICVDDCSRPHEVLHAVGQVTKRAQGAYRW